MKICEKHDYYPQIVFEDYGFKDGMNRSLNCPLCEAEGEISRHEKCQEKLRERNTILLEALKRMVDECERYLEERPTSESDEYNLEYVSPLKQARTAIEAAEGRG